MVPEVAVEVAPEMAVEVAAEAAVEVAPERASGECRAGCGSGAENDDDAKISSASPLRRKLSAGGPPARLSAVFQTILGIPS